MLESILKMNRLLRNVLLLVGAAALIFKVTEKKEREIDTSEEGFQIREFDDIW